MPGFCLRDTEMQTRPKTRQSGLIIRELEDEILVYNTADNNAHCLNRTAALIWKECDGRSTIAEISDAVTRRLGTPVDERVVWFALKQFDRDRLLEDELTVPPEVLGVRLNRRDLVRVLGIAAIVAVPLVTSIVAPSAVQAATCLGTGNPCKTAAQCCSGMCSPGPDGAVCQ
jgi:hypothetical protein